MVQGMSAWLFHLLIAGLAHQDHNAHAMPVNQGLHAIKQLCDCLPEFCAQNVQLQRLLLC